VGNDLGVFFSEDGGQNFLPWNEGLFTDAVLVMDLNISPSNRKLRIASHGNGAFERDLAFEAMEVGTNQLQTGVKLFPNPAQDRLFVTGVVDGTDYLILDLNGKKLNTGKLNTSINISKLAAGQYMIQFGGDRIESFTKSN